MRDMAKIVTVASKGKMFEKDRICYVSFEENAYECIVPNTLNVGDKMVFIEADSILPIDEKWEFLRKRCYREDLQGFLIKCMTMGKKANEDGTDSGERVKSWGLCVTLAEAGLPEDLKAGTDVTDKLKIRKYEPAEDASPKKMPKLPRIIKFFLKHKLTKWIGNIYMENRKRKFSKGNFPTEIISKSDETTIQNYKSVISMFPGTKAYITAKMEGQSFTCSLDAKKKDAFYVCSRNNRFDRVDDTSKVFWATAERYDIANKLKTYLKKTGIRLMIQGEQVGPSIQENIYGFKKVRWFVFRMKGLENGQWVEYSYPKMSKIVKELGLDIVPLLETVDDMAKYESVESLVKRAEESYWKTITDKNGNVVLLDFYLPKPNEKLWKQYAQHEGIVVKSDNYNKERGTGFSFKVKNLAYAEKGLKEIAKVQAAWK